MNTTLAVDTSTSDLAAAKATEQRWSLIQRTFARDATADEWALFRGIAEREGLDPLTREIHFGRDDSGRVCGMVGVHGLVGRLTTIPGFRGIQSAAVYAADDFVVNAGDAVVTHKYRLKDRGVLVAAWARGQIGDSLAVLKVVLLDEYLRRKKTGEIVHAWAKMPATMLEKVARVQCARALAPKALHGLYAAEEFGGVSEVSGAVTMPEAEIAIDPIVPAIELIEEVPDLESLEVALVGLREEAKAWSPADRRRFAARVAQLKADLIAIENAKRLDAHDPQEREPGGDA